MAPAPVAPPDPRFDPAEEFVRPPDEDFWEKYSRRLEFPTSWVGALLIWAIAFALFYAYSKYLSVGAGGEVPVRILDVDTGDGVTDGGTAGPGGDPVLVADDRAFEVKPVVEPLPTLPQGTEAFPPPAAAKKQDGQGAKAGPGTGAASGQGQGATAGDGGGRPGLGWTIRFKFEDAREFCQQLAAAKAVVYVPEGKDGKKGTLYTDLTNPQVGRPAEKSDPIFNGRLGMYEQDAKKVAQMLKFLGAPEATTYGVFFPKEFYDELATKELAYRNRRKEDIGNTVFAFRMRDGKYEVVVIDQTVKK